MSALFAINLREAGHNRIITYSPVAVAVDRAFADIFD